MIVQCESCGAGHGLHQQECVEAVSGLGLGVRRRRTAAADKARWVVVKRRLWERDVRCRFPDCLASRLLHAHHVETVQECQSRGLGWESIDRLSNLVALCHAHHARVHDAIFLEESIGWGLRVAAPKQGEVVHE